MTDLALVRPLPDRRIAPGDDRLLARIAAIVEANPPAGAVAELKRLLAVHASCAGGPKPSTPSTGSKSSSTLTSSESMPVT